MKSYYSNINTTPGVGIKRKTYRNDSSGFKSLFGGEPDPPQTPPTFAQRRGAEENIEHATYHDILDLKSPIQTAAQSIIKTPYEDENSKLYNQLIEPPSTDFTNNFQEELNSMSTFEERESPIIQPEKIERVKKDNKSRDKKAQAIEKVIRNNPGRPRIKENIRKGLEQRNIKEKYTVRNNRKQPEVLQPVEQESANINIYTNNKLVTGARNKLPRASSLAKRVPKPTTNIIESNWNNSINNYNDGGIEIIEKMKRNEEILKKVIEQKDTEIVRMKKRIKGLEVQKQGLEAEVQNAKGSSVNELIKQGSKNINEENIDKRRVLMLKNQNSQLLRQNNMLRMGVNSQKSLSVETDNIIKFLIDQIQEGSSDEEEKFDDIRVGDYITEPQIIRKRLQNLSKKLKSAQEHCRATYHSQMREEDPPLDTQLVEDYDRDKRIDPTLHKVQIFAMEESLHELLGVCQKIYEEYISSHQTIGGQEMIAFMNQIRKSMEQMLRIGIDTGFDVTSFMNYHNDHEIMKNSQEVAEFDYARNKMTLKVPVFKISESIKKMIIDCANYKEKRNKLKKFVSLVEKSQLITECILQLREKELYLHRSYMTIADEKLMKIEQTVQKELSQFTNLLNNKLYFPFQDMENVLIKANEGEANDRLHLELFSVFNLHYEGMGNAFEQILNKGKVLRSLKDNKGNIHALKRLLTQNILEVKNNLVDWSGIQQAIKDLKFI